MTTSPSSYPNLHNAAWPGLVGKGDDSEPPISLDAMLDFTADAEVNGVKFDGIDLMLAAPHVDVDSTDDQLQELAAKVTSRNLVIGTVVAPVWPPLGGGSTLGDSADQQRYLTQIEKACRLAAKLTELGVRPYGAVRIDSATDPATWAKDPQGSQQKIADVFRRACEIAEAHGQQLAAEGEICWGGMHSWRRMVELLEMVDRPKTLGFQADLAHTLLYLLGHNAPEDALLKQNFAWDDETHFYEAYKDLTDALRPWTIDFHVAQNDATVFGSGSHDKTGKHCLPNDPEGKLDITKAAGFWLRDQNGELTKTCQHICWDGCMFSNEILQSKETWNQILACMIDVRNVHGWSASEA